jgi:hypothetical protein
MIKNQKVIQSIIKVIFYWDNECTQDGKVELPKTKKVKCDLTCNDNEHIKFDIATNQLICDKCAAGTSSVKIKKFKFDKNSLAQFTNNCYIVDNGETILNKDCNRFKVLNNTLIAGGEMKKVSAKYYYELVYNVHMKRDGNVYLKINHRLTFHIRKAQFKITNLIMGNLTSLWITIVNIMITKLIMMLKNLHIN